MCARGCPASPSQQSGGSFTLPPTPLLVTPSRVRAHGKARACFGRPSPSYPWVGQFRPWLKPRRCEWQRGCLPGLPTGRRHAEPGTRHLPSDRAWRGILHLHHPGLLIVVAGYSYGASLAFYYAADARRWRLPVPRAVDGIFPAGLIPGAPLKARDRALETRLLRGTRCTEAEQPTRAAHCGLHSTRSSHERMLDPLTGLELGLGLRRQA